MFKKLFGPFPDEPLLYSLDKILGLFHKFDTKLECKAGAKDANEKQIPVEVKFEDVNDNATTASDVTIMKKISMEIVETSSHTSKKSTLEYTTISNSNKSNQERRVPQPSVTIVPQPPVTRVFQPPETRLSQPPDHNSTLRSILKTSSSMECNYALSKVNVGRKTLHNGHRTKRVNSCTKSTKRYAQNRGFGDSVAVVENKVERRSFKSDGKSRFEQILKTETKHQKVTKSPKINRVEQLCNRTLNELTRQQHKTSKNVKQKDRKVISTEWAVTRIYTFDDDSQTYEVMKKDKVLEKNGGIEKIFAIAPNLTTVAYEPIKPKGNKR